MVARLLNKQCYRFFNRIFCEKYVSELHSSVTNDIIAKYSDKSQRSALKNSGYLYIINKNVANTIASHISENWKDGYILEANPGPGILSSAILQNGIKNLRVCEKNKDFLPALKVLNDIYPSLEIVQEDLLFLPSHDYKHSNNLSDSEIFRNIPEKEWTDDPIVRIFSIISGRRSIKFARYLLISLSLKSSIFSFGRCDLFLLVSEKEYTYITAVPRENLSTYRWATVLYNIFFEIKLLDKFPSESLFPINCNWYHKKHGDYYYFVKLSPKPELFSSMVTHNKLGDLYFFVRHHLVKRSALVIPTMEGWIPSCGPRLIKEGMKVFTKFGDLSPNQILLLFNQFSSWPEYKDSAFQTAAIRNFGKETPCQDDEDAH